jgi:hypothetical protein
MRPHFGSEINFSKLNGDWLSIAHLLKEGSGEGWNTLGSETVMSANVVITPGGPRERSEVRLIQPGQTVVVSKRVRTMLREDTQSGRPDQANWITAAWIDLAGASIKSFSATWKVPAPPNSMSSQLL